MRVGVQRPRPEWCRSFSSISEHAWLGKEPFKMHIWPCSSLKVGLTEGGRPRCLQYAGFPLTGMLHSFWNTPDPFLRAHLWLHLLLVSPVVISQDDSQSLSRDVWTAGLAHWKHWRLRASCQSQRFMLSEQLQLKLMRPLNFWEVAVRNTQSHSSLSHPRGLLGWVRFPLCCLSSIYRLHSTLYFSIQKCM